MQALMMMVVAANAITMAIRYIFMAVPLKLMELRAPCRLPREPDWIYTVKGAN